MSKAEDKAKQRALEAYPVKEEWVGNQYGSYGDVNERFRGIYQEGYHQAENDLELIWEDIPEIFRISERLKTSWWFRDNEQTKLIGTQVFWEEVLKRFKDLKNDTTSK